MPIVPMECSEDGCDATVAVRIHVPWDEDRNVCAAHGRALGQPDGVVATTLDDTDAEWP